MWKKLFGGKSSGEGSSLPEGISLKDIDQSRLPRHVAIIMDGNGRWANERGLLRTAGHSAGVKALKQVLRTAVDLRLEALTVYAFSTENWKRPHREVDFLMALFADYLARELQEMNDNNIRIHFLGRPDGLPATLLRQMREAERLMAENTGVKFNVAANYGGQDEILRAVRHFAAEAAAGRLKPEDIDKALWEKALDTADSPPVDLVIRTSGDLRLSNFLLWQSAYAEFWFTDVNWPDFTPAHFLAALYDFGQRDRRFGGLSTS